jgi:DNA-directed RNA polymerase specialized sigma24 family protein
MWRVSKGATLRYPQPGGPDERRHRFEELYAANCGPILGYVLRRTDNPDDAADVIAETFLTAWRRLDAVPPGDEARLWLYGVARRVLANYRRGERRRAVLADRPGQPCVRPRGPARGTVRVNDQRERARRGDARPELCRPARVHSAGDACQQARHGGDLP